MATQDQIRRKFQHAYPLLMLQSEENSFSRFGFEVGPGWLPLVFEIFGLLDDLQKRSDQAFRISQVKEKYGSLRIYASLPGLGVEEDLLEVLGEYLSVHTCEVCGSTGTLNTEGYQATLCQDHRGISEEAIRKACHEAQEGFLAYERQGLDTSQIVYCEARKSASEELGGLTVFYFPDRLLDVRSGLLEQLAVQSLQERSVSFLASVFEELQESGRIVLGSTDGSPAGDRIFGRPVSVDPFSV